MELPFHLKALPPEALDVIRYFGVLETPIAHADDIIDGVGLSDRTFGKVIRRLVTKGYLQMDGDQAYRLSDHGQSAVEELTAYDESGAGTAKTKREVAVEQILRRLLLVTPNTLVAGRPAQVHVAFQPDSGDSLGDDTMDMAVRFSLINGDPARPQEASLELDDGAASCAFQVTPGLFKCLRIRVQVFQLGPNPDDISVAGGMYVDLDVLPAADGASSGLSAYGADIVLIKTLD